jgi:hypothetical protein
MSSVEGSSPQFHVAFDDMFDRDCPEEVGQPPAQPLAGGCRIQGSCGPRRRRDQRGNWSRSKGSAKETRSAAGHLLAPVWTAPWATPTTKPVRFLTSSTNQPGIKRATELPTILEPPPRPPVTPRSSESPAWLERPWQLALIKLAPSTYSPAPRERPTDGFYDKD